MRGVRLRDLDGRLFELAVAQGRFVEPSEHVEEWLDLRHGYALPGLVDAHSHLTGADVETMVEGLPDVEDAIARHARLHLEGGVLAIADKGARDLTGLSALTLPVTARPEMTAAGTVVSVEEGYYEGFGRVVDPGSDPASWIPEVSPAPARWLKLIGDWPRKGRGALPNFDLPALEAIVEAAHALDLRVAIHTAAPETPSMAVAAGVDSIEHGLFLTEDDVQALGARGGAWVPTVAAMEGIRDDLKEGSSGRALFDRGLANVRSLLALAPEAGVQVLAGTDLHLPHGQVAREALRLVDYGLGAGQALAAVTSTAHRYLGFPAGLRPGHPADVVVVDADPRDDLSALLKPLFVMRAGEVVTG